MASFFPKALLFKEWRQQRFWLLAGLLTVVVEPLVTTVSQTIDIWTMPEDASARRWMLENTYTTQFLLGNHGTGLNSTIDLLPFVAAGIGAVSFCLERGQGGLWFTLSGPVSRPQVFRVKCLMAWLGVLSIVTVVALVLMGGIAVAHLNISFGQVAKWWCYEVFLTAAILACSFVAGTLIGNVIAAAAGAFGIASIPLLASGFMQAMASSIFRYGPTEAQPINPYQAPAYLSSEHIRSIGDAVAHLGPMYYTGMDVNNFASLMAVGIVWALLGLFIARWLFNRAPLENYANFFIYSVMWKFLLLFVCMVVALLFTVSVRHAISIPRFLITFVLWSGVLWTVSSFVIRFVRKKYSEV